MTRKKNSAVSTAPSLKKQKSPGQKKTGLQNNRKITSEPKFLLGLKRYLIQRNQKVKVQKKKSGGIGAVSSTSNMPRLSASSASSRKRKSPAESPPILPMQESNDVERKFKCNADSPPFLPIQSPVPYVKEEKNILRESNAVCPATFVLSTSHRANVRAGFDRNLEPYKIVKMAEFQGKLYFIMKWKGIEIMDLIPTKIANEKCPQLVIEFYEKHLTNVHNRAEDSY